MLVDSSVMNLAIATAPEIWEPALRESNGDHHGHAGRGDEYAGSPAVPTKHDPQPLAQSRGDSAYFVVTRRR